PNRGFPEPSGPLTNVSISSGVRGRPDRRQPLPSYFWAISFRCHASTVTGVTIVAISRNSFLPSPIGLAASRRRFVRGEAEAALPQLLPKNAVLLVQVVDHLQLTLVHPPGNSDQEEPERIKYGAHMIGHYRVPSHAQ